MADNRTVKPEDAFVLITPMHRQMTAGTAWCIEKAHQVGIPFIWLPHPGDALIDRARSIVLTKFMESFPYPYAIFLDSDIYFEPQHLVQLHKRLKEGYELIGGVYVVRSAQQVAHYGKMGKIRIDGEVHEVEYVSTGFTGISKALLQRMVKELDLPICHEDFGPFRCYPFFESGRYLFTDDAGTRWIFRSEDWDFCDKVKSIGVKCYVDTAILLGHEGTRVWGINDLPPDVATPLTKTTDASGATIYLPQEYTKTPRDTGASRLVVSGRGAKRK